MDTILLINDSVTLTKVLTSHFRKAGYQVIAVNAAMDAYEAFIKNEVHLILSDYVLKDKDGLEVVKTFRSKKTQEDLPIVVFTAIDKEETIKECRDAGASLVLPKSGNSDHILTEIERLIDEYKSRVPSSSIDTDMGNCIVKSTTEVFKTMIGMKVVPGDIIVEKAQNRKASVIGSIGVAGFLSGSISIFLDRSFAAKASANMLMMDDPAELTDDDLVDAVGELTNMVGGNIKTELFKKTPLFDISVPNVYVGADLERRAVSNDLCFYVPFTFEDESFSVEFLMITTESADTTGVQASIKDALVGGAKIS